MPPVSQTISLAEEGRDEAPTALLYAIGRADEPLSAARPLIRPIEGALTIGREGEGAALVLADPLLSRRHARIERTGGGYRVVDLGSRNGTFVNGRRLTEGAAPLAPGDVLFLGHHAFVLRLVSRVETAALGAQLPPAGGQIGTLSPALALVSARLRVLAQEDRAILIGGETGVGKEVYARAVHEASGRRGPFVAVNCAAIPRELVESEIFGYARGAHSQAHAAKAGLVEQAQGGTLFLDELGEMPQEAQAKLLRLLQTRDYLPLGGTTPRRLDARVIAATHREVGDDREGGLRRDLAARLGAPLVIPPLRERIEDLGGLCLAFMAARPRAFTVAAFQALTLHGWPGNVRELERVIADALSFSAEIDRIELHHLPPALLAPPVARQPAPEQNVAGAGNLPVRARQPAPGAAELESLLARTGGNVAEVARALGRHPAVVWRAVRAHGLDPERHRPQS